ncbi:hypothetical protein D3C76_1448190 [compost metagenome]
MQGHFGDLQRAGPECDITGTGQGAARHARFSPGCQGNLLAGQGTGLGAFLVVAAVLVTAPEVFAMAYLFIHLVTIDCGTDIERIARLHGQMSTGLE